LTRDACHSDGGHVLVSIERAVAQIVDPISPAVHYLQEVNYTPMSGIWAS